MKRRTYGAQQTMTDKPHSITRHPLAGEPDFAQIRSDVQFARITWPVGFEVVPPVFMRRYGPLNKPTGEDYRADNDPGKGAQESLRFAGRRHGRVAGDNALVIESRGFIARWVGVLELDGVWNADQF